MKKYFIEIDKKNMKKALDHADFLGINDINVEEVCGYLCGTCYLVSESNKMKELYSDFKIMGIRPYKTNAA